MGHVVCAHDLVRPLSINVVELVNLEPGSDTGGILCGVDRAEKHVSDGSGVAGLVPLNLDGVSLVGSDGVGDTSLSVDVAGNVFAGNVGYRAVGWGHPNADLVTRSHIIDPELVEILVS